eukprot:4230086-Pleurochrysis_carterae.AAC.1
MMVFSQPCMVDDGPEGKPRPRARARTSTLSRKVLSGTPAAINTASNCSARSVCARKSLKLAS